MSKSKAFLIIIVFIIGFLSILYFLSPSNNDLNNNATLSSPIIKATQVQKPNTVVNILEQKKLVSSKTQKNDGDGDGDGVPDRMNDYIKKEFSNSITLQIAMKNLAQAWNLALADNLDKKSAKDVGNKISKSIACLLNPIVLTKTNNSFEKMNSYIQATRAEMLNTPKNTIAYIHFNELLNGQYFHDQGTTPCSNDVTQAPY
ncbi:MAG: hypothetical protein ACN6N1_09275 [Acinetobacter guillouiae]